MNKYAQIFFGSYAHIFFGSAGQRRCAVHPACRFAALAALSCFAVIMASLPLRAAADDDLESLEQKALTAAVQRVAPSVVGIETVGGLERVKKVLFGAGPTTGLVIDSQGYIVSSAFNFVNKPASILVRLPDGKRKPAKLVATDHSRMIVLLKIEVERPLPVPEIAPEADLRVGQWCVGVGRTFESERREMTGPPNMSVGILSAVGRVWGKALQSDAALSPSNYGGPLVDIRGRVMGVIVPLSPQSADEMAGVEWYDSGIGFAIPAEQIRNMLPKLKKGHDLYAGVAGFNLKSRDIYADDTSIAACRPNSPAAKAGFQAGDRIVEIAGRKITRPAEVKEEISRRYAGDKITVVVLRDKKRIQAEIELFDKLDPYQHPLLGILPLRATGKGGVSVRYVYPRSPAARAGVAAGDVVVKLAGKAVGDRDELLHELGALEAGQEAEIEVRHADQTRTIKLKLGRLPEELPPADLPPAHAQSKPAAGQVKTGVVQMRIPEFKNEVWAYVPDGYDLAVPYGLVVWLHGKAVPSQKELLERWKPLCDRYDLVLVVPKSADAGGWKPDEAALVEKLIRQAQSAYHLDPTRVVIQGSQSGGTLACIAAFRFRDLVRAAVLSDTMPAGQPPENEPLERLAIVLTTAEKEPKALITKRMIAVLRAKKIPVTVMKLGENLRELTPAELADLTRWIDTLDRM